MSFIFFSRYNDSNLLPLRVSKYQSNFVVDLLLLNDLGMHHYVGIKKLNKLVSKMQNIKLRSRNMLCQNCFQRYSSVERLERHQLFCGFLRCTIQFTLVFGHILKNYGLHHVLKSLQETNTRNTFSVVPLNDEKIISLTKKLWIRLTATHARYTEYGLPARGKWTNTLQGVAISVSVREYKHAWIVYTRFDCYTMGK